MVRSLFLLMFSVCLAQTPSHALRLDNFSTEQLVFASGGGSIESDSRASTGSIGGFRSIELAVQSGSGLFVIAQNGILSHSQSAQVTGQSLISWDGNLNAALLNPAGLGGIDFTQDGGDALRVKIVSFDFAFSFPTFLVFTLYDASDPTGLTYSSGTLPLTRAYTNEFVELPFSQLNVVGPHGPAQMNNIGAASLLIDGKFPAVDLELSFIGTNGLCDSIPENGKVIDECGVCGGNGSTCADCLGTPNGPHMPQSACMTSAYGSCSAGVWSDTCKCTSTISPQAEVCDGVDNDCNGKVDEIVDQCGVCGGDGLSCLGCQGTNLEPLIAALDGNGRVQHSTINQALRRLKHSVKTEEVSFYVADAARRSLALRDKTWRVSWTVPAVHVQCSEANSCATVENQSTVAEYQESSTSHRALLEEVLVKVESMYAASARWTRLMRRNGDKQLRRAYRLAEKVPATTLRCSNDAVPLG